MISCGENNHTEPPGLNLDPEEAVSISPGPVIDAEPQTGYLLDSAIEGINYSNSNGTQNKTDSEGAFSYFSGDLLVFSIGNIIVGEYQAAVNPTGSIQIGDNPFKNKITPGALNSDDQGVINRLILLQTLDDDGVPENGIVISNAIHTAAAETELDFTLPLQEFISGEFASFVDYLNDEQLFSSNMPRKIRSEIDALRHFGDLNLSLINLGEVTTTYNSWWHGQGSCTDIGKSQFTVKNKSITFCPNVNGLDGCYQGVMRSNGDILLPEIKKNATCSTLDPGDYLYDAFNCSTAEYGILQANLHYIDGELNGTYEASCNESSNLNKQLVTADFLTTKSEGGALLASNPVYQSLQTIRDDIDAIIQPASCAIDSDCETLTLVGSTYCSLPEYKAYALNTVDTTKLSLKQYIFQELKTIQDNSVNGTTYCYIAPPPTTQCIENSCQLVEN